MTTPAAPGAPEGTEQGITAPGAPAEPATQPQTPPSQPAPGAPQPLGKPDHGQQKPAAPEKPDTPDGPTDLAQLPSDVQKLIKDLRSEATKARTGAKQQAADEARQQLLAEFAAKLGLNPDGEQTADELNTQLRQEMEERDAYIAELEANQTEATFQGHIRDFAAALGLDAKMLAGWGDFRDEVEAELEDEFTDEQLRAAVEKVAKTYVGRPQFAANGTAAPRSGAPMPGAPKQQPARARSLTEAVKRAYG